MRTLKELEKRQEVISYEEFDPENYENCCVESLDYGGLLVYKEQGTHYIVIDNGDGYGIFKTKNLPWDQVSTETKSRIKALIKKNTTKVGQTPGNAKIAPNVLNNANLKDADLKLRKEKQKRKISIIKIYKSNIMVWLDDENGDNGETLHFYKDNYETVSDLPTIQELRIDLNVTYKDAKNLKETLVGGSTGSLFFYLAG
jgi:hypothetical protein